MSEEERPALVAHFQSDGVLHKWDCAESGHLMEFGSAACIACGYADQMTFDEVTEYELQPGDPEYTLWLARGKPVLDADRVNARARTGKDQIETLPGL